MNTNITETIADIANLLEVGEINDQLFAETREKFLDLARHLANAQLITVEQKESLVAAVDGHSMQVWGESEMIQARARGGSPAFFNAAMIFGRSWTEYKDNSYDQMLNSFHLVSTCLRYLF